MELRPGVERVTRLIVIGEMRRISSVGSVMGGKQIKQRLKNEGDEEKDYGMKGMLQGQIWS